MTDMWIHMAPHASDNVPKRSPCHRPTPNRRMAASAQHQSHRGASARQADKHPFIRSLCLNSACKSGSYFPVECKGNKTATIQPVNQPIVLKIVYSNKRGGHLRMTRTGEKKPDKIVGGGR